MYKYFLCRNKNSKVSMFIPAVQGNLVSFLNSKSYKKGQDFLDIRMKDLCVQS